MIMIFKKAAEERQNDDVVIKYTLLCHRFLGSHCCPLEASL